MIPLAKPWIGEDEQRAVAAVLETGQLVQGAMVERFELAVAALVGRKHAVAVSSGTAALQLALKVMQIGPGDEVLCPALSWPSPAHAIRLSGAKVQFVDVDPAEWNSGAEALRAARTSNTKAAIVIDQFGNPARACPGDPRRPSGTLPLIVDAACSLGSFAPRSSPCGSRSEPDRLHELSPAQDLITTGEGGVCLTDDDDARRPATRMLRNHGLSWAGPVRVPRGQPSNDRDRRRDRASPRWIGSTTIRRAAAARSHARYRDVDLEGLPDVQSPPRGRSASNHQTFGVLLEPRHGRDRSAVVSDKLRAERGVEAGRLSYALHKHRQPGGQHGVPMPIAERIEVAERIEAHGLAASRKCDPLLEADDELDRRGHSR